MTWRTLRVSDDGTHHLREGVPLYAARFDEVLAFHPPGLASVRHGGQAWHITIEGQPAYRQRFQRTFGFYDGRAAVIGEAGWHHILPDGSMLYEASFAWCGNFQGGFCSVRTGNGDYYHLDLDGEPAYPQRWAYAGDYRGGIAVVQDGSGRSTHIDHTGRLLHDRWFLDLDVFHKGFARARDEAGWTHVDRDGRPLYTRRFAMVEPFYNGQARVEHHNGALEIIDETGQTLRCLRPPLRSEFTDLSSDLVGYWRTETIGAAVELGVIESCPGRTSEIAAVCGLRIDRTARLLAALGELGLVEQDARGWRLTARGALLRLDNPVSLAGAAVEYRGRLGDVWSSLEASLCADGTWAAADIFALVAEDQDGLSRHHTMLRSYARHDYPAVVQALDLHGTERVIDAGGGLGVLAEMMLKAHPPLHVFLLDRPEVVALASVDSDLAERLRLVGCDIKEPWPVSGDAVVMARVLHDWDDVEAVKILTQARAALPQGGKVFLIEMLLPDISFAGRLCDLHLLMTSGGQERTAAEYSQLLEASGFDFVRIDRLPALPSIIVGIAR